MVKKVISFVLCIIMVASASLVLAGGAPAPARAVPCPPNQYAPAGGNPCAYWGDAPFPGMCGGVVALPFLVVGSLLGGNTVGPYPPVPGPAAYPYAPAPYPPARAYMPPAAAGCPPAYGPPSCAPPPPCGPQAYGPPACAPPPPCGPQAYGPAASGSLFSGLPCLELCSSILGGVTGGTGFMQ
jgi:hypothetical protein